MPPIRSHIRFYLNDRLVTLSDVAPDRTLLDFLRLDRVMRGTKEGCAEGDCGACTVLVGRLDEAGLVYESINACIRLVGSLDGCHVVTVEHLARADGSLHPVQQAMVDYHGSQCGFCTPGFVMSLYGLWLTNPEPALPEIETALQGNLCRCTGYAPIVRAAAAISHYGDAATDTIEVERETMRGRLQALQDGHRVVVETPKGQFVIPADVDDLADILLDMPGATLVAGSTDVGLWVTKFMRDIAPVVFIRGLMDEIAVDGDIIRIGAGVSYSGAFATIAAHIPQLVPLLDRIGGGQVRNMGTIGGNIANGSPIGDTPPPLIALGAEITLRRGNTRRTVRLEDYFIAYGQQDRAKGEFIESIAVPIPAADTFFAAYKISKRRDEDITAVLGAFRIRVEGGVISDAVIAYGGMAATPRRARAVEAALIGAPWTMATIEAALPAFEEDFQPLSDWRASAEYRMLVAKNLLSRFFLEMQGGHEIHILRHEVA
ncbi:xanthine dehydrogenase small subunit [Kaistia dalseonensis]|uniref:Xanthine dehydrogenase small subunit n=1 Tax=Kaistia dalseonensis TaxID=410840 RepID=A0ABU0H2W0_9HYPH|nr:xanthine dehydrogenase small subunit [Kaistia dalseonensis]MCX5494044.1 xanthine dehydrogenase small subunit [Kaistia dalseonensis]MDQ0436622.1 xanthine dehydrogenase small subunit [Kaistia dalseonensis]